MHSPSLLLAGAVVLLGVISAAASVADAPRAAAAAKTAAAAAYVSLALAGGALATPYGRILLAALLLCAAGDILLIPGGRGPAFLGGLASFLAGHLAFAWAFHARGIDPAWLGAGLLAAVVPALLISRWLAAHDVPARLEKPVLLYICAITLMVGSAVGTYPLDGAWIVPVGAVLFMASDVFVARERFVTHSPLNVGVGLPLYFLAQVLLALSV